MDNFLINQKIKEIKEIKDFDSFDYLINFGTVCIYVCICEVFPHRNFLKKNNQKIKKIKNIDCFDSLIKFDISIFMLLEVQLCKFSFFC